MEKVLTGRLLRDFYCRPTLEVLTDIIGKIVVYESPAGTMSARISEAEAYIGEDDPACHAAVGKTARNEIMYSIGGFSYVYFIYGMYHCLNFVTEQEGKPAAILLRGADPIKGIETMRENSPNRIDQKLLSGPGKFCRSFGITREQNGLDLTDSSVYLLSDGYTPSKIIKTPRIGISEGKELPYRYYDSASDSVSKTKKINR